MPLNPLQDALIMSITTKLSEIILEHAVNRVEIAETQSPALKIDHQLIEKELFNNITPPLSFEAVENASATAIQRFWRKHKLKKQFKNTAYDTYMSLLNSENANQASTIMFGRHQAEPLFNTNGYINNSLITPDDHYHRMDETLSPQLLNALFNDFYTEQQDKNINESKDENVTTSSSFNFFKLKKFITRRKTNITENLKPDLAPIDPMRTQEEFDTDEYNYYPISIFKISPIEPLIKDFIDEYDLEIIKIPERSIGFIKIPIEAIEENGLDFEKFINFLAATGLKASPWEIATNISTLRLENNVPQKIVLNPDLPTTITDLYESKIYQNLIKVSFGNYSCTYLAKAVHRLLQSPPPLNNNAVMRIALMLDIANTFYKQNYTRYAFYVYGITHELSLALLADSSNNIDILFDGFQVSSKQFITRALNIETQSINLAAFPAMSGSHAHTIGYNLAKKLCRTNTNLGVIEPSYYEFKEIRNRSRSHNSEIFAITTGPIVSPQGIIPGIDINKFINERIPKDRHSILLIDATTTLYHNLGLNDEALELINRDLLTIIIHASHQKFGLLHTDQAQYGQLYVLYQDNSHANKIINKALNNIRADFHRHIDLRIGAYISSRCNNILEKIKIRHFRNGAILKNLLPFEQYINQSYPYLLTNLDELYFLVPLIDKSEHEMFFEKIIKEVFSDRTSFGHFATSFASIQRLTRISPDASDIIETLLTGTQASLYYLSSFAETNYSNNINILNKLPHKFIELFFSYQNVTTQLSLSEQIVALSVANRVAQCLRSKKIKEINHEDAANINDSLKVILNKCNLLIGREGYSNVQECNLVLKDLLKKDSKSPAPRPGI